MADIVQLTSASEEACADINALQRQLNDKQTCSLENLEKIMENPASELWVAREGEKIVGMVTLAIIAKPSGIVSRLEDVVVDEKERGKGIGQLLCEKAIERAKVRGARSMQLTSRPEREAGNKLYQKLRFALKETNVYRMEL